MEALEIYVSQVKCRFWWQYLPSFSHTKLQSLAIHPNVYKASLHMLNRDLGQVHSLEMLTCLKATLLGSRQKAGDYPIENHHTSVKGFAHWAFLKMSFNLVAPNPAATYSHFKASLPTWKQCFWIEEHKFPVQSTGTKSWGMLWHPITALAIPPTWNGSCSPNTHRIIWTGHVLQFPGFNS